MPFIAQTGVLARHGSFNIFVILTDVFTLVEIPQAFMRKQKEYFPKARENSKGLGMLMVSPSFDYFKSLESDCHNIAFKEKTCKSRGYRLPLVLRFLRRKRYLNENILPEAEWKSKSLTLPIWDGDSNVVERENAVLQYIRRHKY